MWVDLYVCMCVRMYVCQHIYKDLYVNTQLESSYLATHACMHPSSIYLYMWYIHKYKPYKFITIHASECKQTFSYIYTYTHPCICLYTHMHLHMHAYMCIHPQIYIHTYIHAYLHNCICMYTSMITYKCIRTCKHVYTTYIHAYIQTYIHTDMPVCIQTDGQTGRQAGR